MKKVLVFAAFPAPYRVEVFKGLATKYNLFVVFDRISDQERNEEWFKRNTGLNSILLTEDSGIKRFAEVMKELEKYDLVLAYDYHLKNAIKLINKCIWKKIPYIMNVDGAFIRKNPLKNLVKRYIVTNASAYFASGKSAGDYLKYFGATDNKIFYHPFTSLHKTEILNKPLSQSKKKELKKELNLNENKKIVLTIGQFIYRKGFDVLLKAWNNKLDKNYVLVLIGGGPEETKYRNYIKNNSLCNTIIIGYMDKENILEYYKASDLFVLPTREDIWGLVINEAMAFGLPVISTDRCNAALELIEDNINGKIVKADNHEELSAAIEEYIDKYESISVNNIKKIKNYTYENVVKCHINAIEEVIRKKNEKN